MTHSIKILVLLTALAQTASSSFSASNPSQAEVADPKPAASAFGLSPQDSLPTPISKSPSPATAAETPSSAVEGVVVKVFSTARYPDVYKPWTKQAATELTGSGVVISGRRILTNAHVVLYASQVQIQANQAGDKLSASIEAIAPGIDLAVLKLDDETFFDMHRPLEEAPALPGIKDSVMVYGYPTGGTSLSITKGIISRIEFSSYNFPTSGLRIQIDAAINAGNSGGPAVVDDKMVGLAFSRLGGGSESIGYIIPCEEIDLFLQDIADGHYDGKPAMHDDFQTLENDALRSFLKLDKSVEGTVLHTPVRKDPAYPLKQWDLITRIGDLPVDDQGMVKIGPNLRVRFIYFVQRIAKNGKVPLTVVRAGKELKIELPVPANFPLVIPPLSGAYPSYFVYGPVVFSEATSEFLNGFSREKGGIDWLMSFGYFGNPLITRMGDKQAFEGERLVVISSPFFPHKLAKGYSPHTGQVVRAINGHAIKNLPHLVEVLRDSTDPFITIEFVGLHPSEDLVFPRADMLAATDDILSDNGIRSQGSPDVLKRWSAKSPK
jgi:S1-C subfamily serine protease